MSSFNLNLNTYSLQDLLGVFKINNIDPVSIQKAESMVIQMKGNVKPDIFNFFLEALQRIKNVSASLTKGETQSKHATSLEEYHSQFQEPQFNKLSKINGDNCNAKINEIFEKYHLKEEHDVRGYDDFLKQDCNINFSQKRTPFEQDRLIESYRKDIITQGGIEDSYFQSSFQCSDFNGGAPESYSSDMFSKLPYEDLKKAHTQTLVSCNLKDLSQMDKYGSLKQYKHERDTMMNDVNDAYYNKHKDIYYKEQEEKEKQRMMQQAYLMEKRKAELRQMNDNITRHYN